MKTIEVGAFEAKTKLSALLSDVEKGRTYFITRHGRRVAELKPVALDRPRPRLGSGKGKGFWMAPDFDAPLEDFKDYM